MLQGTGVDVQEAGILFVKPRFALQKRPRHVSLTGVQLTVQDMDNIDEAAKRVYDIEKAKLQVQRTNLRIIVVLATKEKISFYAGKTADLERWVKALTDATQWNIQRFYQLGDELGSGAFSTVRKGIHKQSGDFVAVKCIHKGACSEEDMKYFQREIDIARSLQHGHVTRTLDCFESEKTLYIVVEFMAGGALGDVVARFGCISETNARLIMENIFRGLEYIHSKGVVHRDIKPDNLLCTRHALPTIVKLTDFGLARRTECHTASGEEVADDGLGPEGLMTTPVGTPNFVAPEVLHGLPYGKEVDLFSCGVVMYYLLSGRYPFAEEDPEKLMERIKTSDYSFPDKEWSLISEDAMDLVDGLLDRSPYTRLSATKALNHTWIGGPMRTSSYSDAELQSSMSQSSPNKRGSRKSHRGHRNSVATLNVAGAGGNEDEMYSPMGKRKSRLPGWQQENATSPTGVQPVAPYLEEDIRGLSTDNASIL